VPPSFSPEGWCTSISSYSRPLVALANHTAALEIAIETGVTRMSAGAPPPQ
jgi:hypothetical protein